jgi:hypothetical protein
MLGNRKPEIRTTRDGRLILSGSAYAKMKAKLRDLAQSKCEVCGFYTTTGDVDHVVIRGMGGAKRDDRIFVDGKRNLIYKCRGCHTGRHQGEKPCPAKPTPEEFDTMLGL